jgi:hypothetical protein
MCSAANFVSVSDVDIFDGKIGQWRTAKLSVARGFLGATSLPSQGVVLFAGGKGVFMFLLR